MTIAYDFPPTPPIIHTTDHDALPIPFAKWVMDILDPFLKAAGQRKFLFVIVSYFIKWRKAQIVASIIKKKVQKLT